MVQISAVIFQPAASWKPVSDIEGDGAKLYIQKGSKMNDGEFDDETPF